MKYFMFNYNGNLYRSKANTMKDAMRIISIMYRLPETKLQFVMISDL